MNDTDTGTPTETAAVPAPPADDAVTDAATDPATDTDTDSTPTDDATIEDGAEATEASAAREAARYRRRLREVESERDRLTEQVAVLQRAEAERVAADTLADPQDLWRDGATVDSLIGDDGNLDPAKIADLAAATAAAHPHWRKRPTAQHVKRSSGLHSGATKPGDHIEASWAAVIRNAGK